MMDTGLSEISYIKNISEFDNHTSVSFIYDNESGLESFVAIHRKSKNSPSFGATRMWNYVSDTEALQDALRLSRLMSYKAALAGLNCGGAKGVIINPELKLDKKSILTAYAEKISTMKDSFVTGTDVGLSQDDLKIMKAKAPNIVGFNDNSTKFTALGVYYSIQSCLAEVFGNGDVAGRIFAIQGLGKVGAGVLEYLYPEAATIYVSDINPDQTKEIKKLYPNVIAVRPEEIHKQAVDVFVPCALSHAVNTQSINELNCKIIAGGANNQLESKEMGEILLAHDILYAPDYVANAGGLIAVFDEYENKQYEEERVLQKVMGIKDTLGKIISQSLEKGQPTNSIANQMAEEIFNKYE
jgi:leucine dehydrogenase